jgi:hypothetical protein
MSLIPILSVTAVYLVSLFGDACLVIAVAVAATMGGSPWVWGASFALFHALYAFIGLALASELSLYSQFLGNLFALLGSMILLRHFVHHRLHHGTHGDCRCENHEPKPASPGTMLSTAATLSIHALAAGPILQRALGPNDATIIGPLLIATSLLIGTIISAIVLIGETRRTSILRTLDKLPGLVSCALCGMSFFLLFHAVEEMYQFTPLTSGAFALIAVACSAWLGYITHERHSSSQKPEVIQIATRQAR